MNKVIWLGKKISLFGIIAVWGFVFTVSAQNSNEVLTVTQVSAAMLGLGFQGQSNKDYALQTNGSVGGAGWSNAAYFATGNQGQYSATNPISPAAAWFYRTARLPGLTATTTNAVGVEDVNLTITLGGDDPIYSNSLLQAVISVLPQLGQLMQADGTPIVTVPTLVTSSSNVVVYASPTNSLGTNFDSFSYFVRRVANGVTSVSQPVPVTVQFVPYAPIPNTGTVRAPENTPTIFQLTATDPTPPPGAGPLQFHLEHIPTFGSLYQVQADNKTAGVVIIDPTVLVSNADHLLIYVPKTDQTGNLVDSFEYTVENAYGQGDDQFVEFTVYEVPQVPTTSSQVFNIPNTSAYNEFTIPYNNANNVSGDVIFSQTPTNGILYYNGNEVATNTPYPDSAGFIYVKNSVLTNACLGSFAYGTNYDQFQFYVKSSENLSSPVATDVFNYYYVGVPPLPTAPSNLVCGVNTSLETTNFVDATNITLTTYEPALDTNNPSMAYETEVNILSLPQHGNLYDIVYGVPANLADFGGLPAQTIPQNLFTTLTYVPDPGYNSSQGPDSFSYEVSTYGDENTPSLVNPCTYTVNLTVNGPAISTIPTVNVLISTNGGLQANAAVSGFTVYSDATASTNDQISCEFQASASSTNEVASGGMFLLSSVPPYSGISVGHPGSGSIQLTGTPAALSQVFTNGNLGYNRNNTTNTTAIVLTVSQQGGNQSSTRYFLPVTYTYH